MFKNIVIIDDSDYKREDIKEYLQSLFPNANFIECSYINEGLRCIAWKRYDEIQENPNEWLIVSDMVMPQLSDTMPKRDGGFAILSEMNRKHMTSPIIIVSSEEIDTDRATNMYDNFIGFIKHSCSVFNLSDYENLLSDYMD